jgi:hypothetical protein
MDNAAPELETPTPAQAEPGAMLSRLSLGVAIVWIIATVAVSVALLGADGLAALEPAQFAALIAAAVLPALMAMFSGAAAREGARARAEAQRLADAADRLMNPEQSAEEAARKLAKTVRGEINQLDKALEHTLAKLAEVEDMVSRQVRAVDDMSDANDLRHGARARRTLEDFPRPDRPSADDRGFHFPSHAGDRPLRPSS